MIEFEKDKTKLDGIYRGQVLDNNDPEKLGRIKVRIFSVLSKKIKVEYIPWAVPAMPLFTGSGNDFGHFAVPEINSFVWCFFEAGDLYQPVYFAEAPTALHGIPVESVINYPNRRVMKTKNGIVIYIDDTSSSREIKVSHPSGAYVLIDNDGNIVVQGTTVHINPI